jgi:hypothetical protein
MINKKRLIGINLFAIFYLIYSILIILLGIYFREKSPAFIIVAFMLDAFTSIISIGLFRKNIKIYFLLIRFSVFRIGAAIIFSVGYVFSVEFPIREFLREIFWVLFFGLNLYYFTRPGVKERFN